MLSASGDKDIFLWDVYTRKRVRILEGHFGDVTSLSLMPESETLFLSGSLDGTVKVRGRDAIATSPPPPCYHS